MSQDEFRSCCKVTIGKVEEIMVPKLAESFGHTKKAAKGECDKLLETIVTRKPKAPRLLPAKKEIKE